MNDDDEEQSSSFATERFSTLGILSNHIEDLMSHEKNAIKRYVSIKTYQYILAEISAHYLQLKCMGSRFFQAIPT